MYTLGEVHRLLAEAGLDVLACYASTHKQPYELGSRSLDLVAQRQ